MMNNAKIEAALFEIDTSSDSFNDSIYQRLNVTRSDVLGQNDEIDYELIDELPYEVSGRNIMIGFSAQTNKCFSKIEYIDLQTHHNLAYLDDGILNILTDNSGHLDIDSLSKHFDLIKFYDLECHSRLSRIVFHYKGLRYELSLLNPHQINRIRVTLDDNESDVNMRPIYLFECEMN